MVKQNEKILEMPLERHLDRYDTQTKSKIRPRTITKAWEFRKLDINCNKSDRELWSTQESQGATQIYWCTHVVFSHGFQNYPLNKFLVFPKKTPPKSDDAGHAQ